MTAQEIQQYVYDFLHDKGLPHASIVAVMGNIQAESGFDPNIVETGSGVGLGLCQWSYTRRTQLEAYGTDLAHQCEFLWSELTGEDTSITGANFQWINPPSSAVTGGSSFDCSIDNFRSANGTVDYLTTAFCYCWERPAPDTNHLSDVRIPSAENFNTTMTYTGTTPTQGNLYAKIQATPYNTNQLSAEQITFLQTLSINDSVKMKFTFNRNKRQIGQNFLGFKLTFDNKTYTIKDVRNDGYIILDYSGSGCYNYVNPKYIMSNN